MIEIQILAFFRIAFTLSFNKIIDFSQNPTSDANLETTFVNVDFEGKLKCFSVTDMPYHW